MKNKNKNGWKLATIILLVICSGLIAYPYIPQNEKMIDINGFKIPNSTINNFAKIMMDNDASSIRICDLENKDCITIFSTKP